MELPSSFAAYMRELLGSEEYEQFVAALNRELVVSVRMAPLNPPKGGTQEVSSQKLEVRSNLLTANSSPFGGVEGASVPWCSTGYYLPSRPQFTLDPLFHAGCYYVQEASSMFLEQALRQYVADRPVVMLDLCAAPGGKSTHARSLLPDGSLLVANEVMRSRAWVLAENLTKWGDPDVVVTNNDPADFAPLGGMFDVVLTDVPCSGEGMFRKDPTAVSEWSEENVETCWKRQRRIVSDIWPCLKSGGILIYSTCTYNRKEDEENVRWMQQELGAEVLPLNVPAAWNVTGNLLQGASFPVYRFLPHKTEGEGFFLAVVRKVAPLNPPKGGSYKIYKSCKIYKSYNEKEVLLHADRYEFLTEGNRVMAFPRSHLGELAALRSRLRIVQYGVEVAEQKGKDWMPAHGLAMSQALNREAFACEDVPLEQALAYLRREAIVLPPSAPRGIVLLTYRNVPLGFVKNIGNRANNLYPQEWRIRKA